MNRISIINGILEKKGRSCVYVEIGVRNGKCFFNIEAKHRMAVDPEFRIAKRTYLKAYSRKPLQWFRDSFFSLTSDDFFSAQRNLLRRLKPDVIFIDGLHTYEQSYRDVINSLEVMQAEAVIVMHDCNPTNEVAAVPALSPSEVADKNLPGWKGVWCGDVWKSIVRLRTQPDLEVFVLDTDFGLGIVKNSKGKGPALPASSFNIDDLSYVELNANRGELLGLKPVTYFADFLSTVRK